MNHDKKSEKRGRGKNKATHRGNRTKRKIIINLINHEGFEKKSGGGLSPNN